ncbi:MAG: PAS domain S-box protein, partial [Acidimicrobiales bacterium]
MSDAPQRALSTAAPHLLLEGLSDAVIAADDDGQIVYANPSVGRLLGWAPSDLIGRPLRTIIPEDLRDAHVEGFERFLRTREPKIIGRAVAVPALAKDGEIRQVELTLNAVPVGNGTVFVGSLRDLSDSMEAERHRNLSSYLRAVADMAVTLGLSGDARTLDEAAPIVLNILGDALGWQVGDVWLVEPDGGVRCSAAWCRSEAFRDFIDASTGTRFEAGTGLPGRVAQRGEPLWISDVATDRNFPRSPQAAALGLHGGFGFPIKARGEVLGAISFFTHDVREADDDLLSVMAAVGAALGEFILRERAEAASRFRSAILTAEAEAIIDAIIVVGPDGTLLTWNDKFVDLTGISPEQLRDDGLQALLGAAGRLVVDSDDLGNLALDVSRDPDATVRREFAFADGKVVDLYTAPLRDHTTDYGRAFYLRDITEQKQAEQRAAALARSLQASLLPPTDPELPGLDVAARYSAAEIGIDVGGDFYDV